MIEKSTNMKTIKNFRSAYPLIRYMIEVVWIDFGQEFASQQILY